MLLFWRKVGIIQAYVLIKAVLHTVLLCKRCEEDGEGREGQSLKLNTKR